MKRKISVLYGKGIDKVKFQMDKASSHTSKSTVAYLTKKKSETGIKCILFNHIPVKSTDILPLDFLRFWFIKTSLRETPFKNIEQTLETVQEAGIKLT